MVKTNRFAEAIAVQDACNPSGVARSLLEVMSAVRCDKTYLGTDSLRTDPAIRLFVAKLADLCGLDYQWPADAYSACLERSGEANHA